MNETLPTGKVEENGRERNPRIPRHLLTQVFVEIGFADLLITSSGAIPANPRKLTCNIPLVDSNGQEIPDFDLRVALHRSVDQTCDEYERLEKEGT